MIKQYDMYVTCRVVVKGDTEEECDRFIDEMADEDFASFALFNIDDERYLSDDTPDEAINFVVPPKEEED